MKRFFATLITLVVTAAAATAGVGARCLMDGDRGHCGACPDGTTSLRAPMDCPMIFAGSPESVDAVEQANPPVTLAVLGEPIEFASFASVGARSANAIAPAAAPRPPGHAVLRV